MRIAARQFIDASREFSGRGKDFDSVIIDARKRLQEIDSIIRRMEAAAEQIKVVQKGDPGDKGDPGKDGVSPDIADIVPKVLERIRMPKDGRDADEDGIAAKVLSLMPTAEEIAAKVKAPEAKDVDPMSVVEQIMSLPEGKRLTSKHIDGLEQTISAFQRQLSNGYLHGGGLSAVEHDNTLAGDGTKDHPLSVISSGGVQSVTGPTVDNSDPRNPVVGAYNVCFAVNNLPFSCQNAVNFAAGPNM